MTQGEPRRKYHFMLVHGTWARKSEWTKAGTKFRAQLSNALDGDCEFTRLEWRGGNRQRDRLAATSDFTKHLESDIDLSVNTSLFVIAHSHGGNIAATAASDPVVGSRITGLICLNTPFIVRLKRNLNTWMLRLLVLGLTPFPISMLLSAAGPQGGLLWLQGTWPLLATSVATMALCFLAIFTTAKDVRSKQGRAQYMETGGIRCPVLCIRSAGDEATGGLGVLEAIAELPHALLHPLVLSLIFVVFLILTGSGVLSSVPFQYVMADSGWWHWFIVCLASTLIYTSLGAILVDILAHLSGWFLKGLSLGLDLSAPHYRDSLFTRVTVSLTPLAAENLSFLEVGGTEDASILTHTDVYNDKDVIQAIAHWCKEKTTTHKVGVLDTPTI